MLRRTSALVALALITTLLLPGPAIGGRVTVKATNDQRWAPFVTKIVKGTKVVWKNPSVELHTLKSYRGTWMPGTDIASGEKVVKRFTKVKHYYYFCNIHGAVIDGECAGMCGEIRVKRPSG